MQISTFRGGNLYWPPSNLRKKQPRPLSSVQFQGLWRRHRARSALLCNGDPSRSFPPPRSEPSRYE